MRKKTLVFSILGFFMALPPYIALAQGQALILPEPSKLISEFKIPSRVIKVIEPHVSTPEKPIAVTYIGFDSHAVFRALLGDSWTSFDGDIEFRALDGYVSQIEISRFKTYRSFLVYAIKGQPKFTVDNPGQNEKDVPLGPYYLVWDNLGRDELLKDGATDWPYQVDRIRLSDVRKTALLPGHLAAKYAQEARLTQRHCLTCHQISGYGGNKWPGDLALSVKAFDEKRFTEWVLNPSALKPGTQMPALLPTRTIDERQEIAKRIFVYLRDRDDYRPSK